MASVVGFPAVYQRVVAHWRAITLLLILALGTFLIAHAEFFLLFVIALLFTASQIFWIRRIIDVGERLLPGQPGRARVAVIVNLAYLFVIAYSYPTTIGQGHTFRIDFYRLPNIVAEAVFWWWFVGSMLAFVLVIVFGVVDRAARAAAWMYRHVEHARLRNGMSPLMPRPLHLRPAAATSFNRLRSWSAPHRLWPPATVFSTVGLMWRSFATYPPAAPAQSL
jgi:hypothetical protein